jgi:hypothetical protein
VPDVLGDEILFQRPHGAMPVLRICQDEMGRIMDTAVITIGNSDDKLTQKEWSEFVSDVQDFIMRWAVPIHFHGLSVGSAPWQNACWVIDIHLLFDQADEIRNQLSFLASTYKQDSIALTIGSTEFVKG